MTKQEMIAGFAEGRRLTQEEWTTPAEITALDECIAEGRATIVSDWRYDGNFQCARRIVRGIEAMAT